MCGVIDILMCEHRRYWQKRLGRWLPEGCLT